MKKRLILPFMALSGLLYGGVATAFTLNTTAFQLSQLIPEIYTCQGRDIAPDLSWSDAPEGTQSFALIMEDPDAPSGLWIHWVLFNIPSSIKQLNADTLKLPAGFIEGKNSWGKTGYRGPCPPPGSTHHYIFTLYALDRFLTLPKGATAQQVRDAAKDFILEKAEIMGTYYRSP